MASEPQIQEWLVEGLDCPSCAATVEKACGAVPGVRAVKANAATGTLRVTYQPADFKPAALAAAARRAGHPLRTNASASPRLWLPTAISAGALLLGLALLLTGRRGEVALVVAVLAGALPLLPRAWGALRAGRADMNLLMTIALGGALGLGDYLEAAVLALLFAISQWLERRSLARTGRAVESLLELAPRLARVERAGAVAEVPVEQVAVGERLRLRPGDLVPLDGVVAEGRSAVDQAPVTGESVPVDKGPGEPVFAASRVVDGALVVTVTHTAADSTLARVVKLVEEAQLEGSPTSRVIDRFAAWYTPAIMLLAVLVAAIPPVLLGQPFAEWFYRGLVLLVIGCPCALVIATPVAIQSGLTAAARRGILVRGGDALEAAAQLGAVAFDKTGTLTSGQPCLQRLARLPGAPDEATLLEIAAGLEADSTHPLGRALVAAAAARGLSPRVATAHRATPGAGISGQVDGLTWRLGNRRLMQAEGVALAPAEAALGELEEAGLTAVVLAAERPLALFGLADSPRPEASEVIAELRTMGVARVVMLTGDNPRTARAVAAQSGLDEVHAELRPEDKQAALRALQAAHGPTAMVGDGINDAPALAAATVGIALGAAGSEIALETARVGLLGDDLRALPRLVRIARRTRRIIAANIVIAFAIRLLLVPLAIAGLAPLWLAILGDMGGSLLVTANSLRVLQER